MIDLNPINTTYVVVQNAQKNKINLFGSREIIAARFVPLLPSRHMSEHS
jgi:hypothetical protein